MSRYNPEPSAAHRRALSLRRPTHMSDSPPSKFAQQQSEPLFMAIPDADEGFQQAYARASETLPRFMEHIQSGIRAYFSAKLRFRDPVA